MSRFLPGVVDALLVYRRRNIIAGKLGHLTEGGLFIMVVQILRRVGAVGGCVEDAVHLGRAGPGPVVRVRIPILSGTLGETLPGRLLNQPPQRPPLIG